MYYAIIDTSINQVTNVIEMPDDEEIPPLGDSLIVVEIGQPSDAPIGWTYMDGKFSAPIPTAEEIEAARQQRITSNMLNKNGFMQRAIFMLYLNDIAAQENATQEDKDLAKEWSDYRIVLSKVNANTDKEVKWPDQPRTPDDY